VPIDAQLGNCPVQSPVNSPSASPLGQELPGALFAPLKGAEGSLGEQKQCLELQQITTSGLQQLLRQEKMDGDAQKKRREKKRHQPHSRVANKHCLMAVDWALLKCNGWGLAAFLPAKAVGPLPEGGRRYFAETKCPISKEPRRRACVTMGSQNRWFEVPHRVVEGAHWRPTLHLTQDMGSASWQGGVWLVNGLGIRGTISWDRFHRHQCDQMDACAESGLMLVRLEMAAWLALRRGPSAKIFWRSGRSFARQRSLAISDSPI